MPTTQADVAMLALARKKSFSGLTDKYAVRRPTDSNLEEEVASKLGMLDIAVSAGVYNAEYVSNAQTRTAKYQEYIRFFKGEHWISAFDDGELKPVTNFCKTIVNKSSSFFVAEGLMFGSTEGNEEVAAAMQTVWEGSGGNHLFRSTAMECSLLGDSYLLAYIETNDMFGNELPKGKWSIKLKKLESVCVFPLFNSRDPRVLDVCVVQYPIGVREGSVQFVTHIYWPDKIRTYSDAADAKAYIEVPNPFGVVPIVHFCNKLDPTSKFGQSDLYGLTELNREYNSVKLSIKRIISYHAEPTTVIYGARASNLEKGSKKVWSGLPVDARVENLAFDSDLPAANGYLADLKNEIREESGLPDVAFQTNNPVSNTSGIALRILYAPLYEKRAEKQTSFTYAFGHLVYLLDRGFKIIGVDLSSLADDPARLLSVFPKYSDPLPKDMSAELDYDIKRRAEGIVSRAALLRKYNPGENYNRLTVEIIADSVEELARKREDAVALAGGNPNLTAPLLSSIAINEEVADLGTFLSDTSEEVVSDPAVPIT